MHDGYAEISLRIQSKSDSSELPLRDFAKVLHDISAIHDMLAKIKYPSCELIPTPRVTVIEMHSPAWIQFISFEDIANAIAKLLKIPKEIANESLKLEQTRRDIEKTQLEIEAQKSSNLQGNLEAQQRQQILDEQLKRERITTLTLAHESTVKIISSYIDILPRNPSVAVQLGPLTYDIAKRIQDISQSAVEIGVVDYQLVGVPKWAEEDKKLLSDHSLANTDKEKGFDAADQHP